MTVSLYPRSGVLLMRKEPIASKYSLDRLEQLVLADIERLEGLLAQAGEEGLNGARAATVKTYREMLETRKQLLAEIREQSREFQQASLAV